MLKLLRILFVFSAASFSVLAAGIDYLSPTSTTGWHESVYDWGKFGKGEASTILTSYEKRKTDLVIDSIVDHSKDGEKRMYIRLYYLDGRSTCKSPYQDYTDHRIIKVNGQALKTLIWCNKTTDEDVYYLSVTPETNAGSSYLVNSFKRAAKSVYFEMGGVKANLSAIGFSKVWASAGGDAI